MACPPCTAQPRLTCRSAASRPTRHAVGSAPVTTGCHKYSPLEPLSVGYPTQFLVPCKAYPHCKAHGMTMFFVLYRPPHWRDAQSWCMQVVCKLSQDGSVYMRPAQDTHVRLGMHTSGSVTPLPHHQNTLSLKLAGTLSCSTVPGLPLNPN